MKTFLIILVIVLGIILILGIVIAATIYGTLAFVFAKAAEVMITSRD